MLKRTLALITCSLITLAFISADDASNWQAWVKSGQSALPAILNKLDTASPTQANWLRTAADAIVENALKNGETLDLKPFEAILINTERNGRLRRMCFEWITKVKPDLKEKMIAGFLNDPSLELRRDAVAQLITKAKAKKDASAADWRSIVSYARDRDQVDEIGKALKALNEELDTAAHFGFIREWAVLSTFDNSEEKGFAIAYEPEKKFDWKMNYTGKDNKPATWKKLTSKDPYGKVDLAKEIGKHKSAIAYAATIVTVDSETPVELRANSYNALKVWLNGKEVIAHEEYHHGDNMDQYVGKGVLKPGENTILVKVCQNDQKEPWAQSWEFALRICDNVGTATRVSISPVPIEEKK
jgi:hypothetical protein